MHFKFPSAQYVDTYRTGRNRLLHRYIVTGLLGLIGVGSPYAIARWPHPDAQLINKESLSAEKATNFTQIVALFTSIKITVCDLGH